MITISSSSSPSSTCIYYFSPSSGTPSGVPGNSACIILDHYFSYLYNQTTRSLMLRIIIYTYLNFLPSWCEYHTKGSVNSCRVSGLISENLIVDSVRFFLKPVISGRLLTVPYSNRSNVRTGNGKRKASKWSENRAKLDRPPFHMEASIIHPLET